MPVKAVVIFSLVVMLTGCTTVLDMAKSIVPDQARSREDSSARLDGLRSVFVALPADGESACATYLGSGQSVAQAVAEAFAKRGITVEVAKKRSTYGEALASAARLHAGYLVLPIITHWEQRNEWLGPPSRLAIRVSVIETATGLMVASESIKSYSVLPLSFTVESPEALLEKPLSHYVSNLY